MGVGVRPLSEGIREFSVAFYSSLTFVIGSHPGALWESCDILGRGILFSSTKSCLGALALAMGKSKATTVPAHGKRETMLGSY